MKFRNLLEKNARLRFLERQRMEIAMAEALCDKERYKAEGWPEGAKIESRKYINLMETIEALDS